MATRVTGITASRDRYVAPAEGFLSGLERGIGIYQKLFEEPEKERQREEERRQDREYTLMKRRWEIADRARTESEREEQKVRQTEDEALRAEEAAALQEQQALKLMQDQLSAEAAAAYAAHGADVPREIKQALGARFGEWSKRNEQFEKALESLAQKKRQRAAIAASKLAKVRDPSEANPADVRLVVEGLGFRVGDLLRGAGGSPSKVEAALQSAAEGIETGNYEKVVDAANTLFRRELMRGVGSVGQDGTPIISKEIVGFVPHPDQDKRGLVTPVLRVRTMGNPTQGYIAPVTANRSSSKDDNAIFMSVDSLLKHGETIRQLADAVNQGDLAERLRQEDAAATERGVIDPASLFARIPIPASLAAQLESTRRAAQQDETRKAVAETRAGATVDAATARAEAAVRAAGIRASGKQAGQSGARPSKEPQPKHMTRGEVLDLARGELEPYGIVWDGKSWLQRDAKGNLRPASADSMQIVARVMDKITRSAVQGKVGAPPAPLPRNEADAVVGKVYTDAQGKLVRYLGGGSVEYLE